MPSDTLNVKLGVCTVIFDGVDLGYTKGGVEYELQTNTHEVKVDQFGETPIGELITGRMVSAKIPLAETTLENLVRTMPGAVLTSNGVLATNTVTFSTGVPIAGDKITIAGQDFTFRAAPVGAFEMPIPATFTACAPALAKAVNNAGLGVIATAVGAVVTLTATQRGVASNLITVAKTYATPANCTVLTATMTGGVDATKAIVKIATGVSINLLSLAKRLILRPKGTTGAEDLIMPVAATAGGMNFAYKIDDERVFMTTFKGYPDSNGNVTFLGDENG